MRQDCTTGNSNVKVRVRDESHIIAVHGQFLFIIKGLISKDSARAT